MKTIDEIINTILNDKRITKEETVIIFREYNLTCIRLNDAAEKIKALTADLKTAHEQIDQYEKAIIKAHNVLNFSFTH